MTPEERAAVELAISVIDAAPEHRRQESPAPPTALPPCHCGDPFSEHVITRHGTYCFPCAARALEAQHGRAPVLTPEQATAVHHGMVELDERAANLEDEADQYDEDEGTEHQDCYESADTCRKYAAILRGLLGEGG